jgi:hypothetical protein
MFDCALRQLNQLGYTVTNAEKGAGLIVAERQTSGAVSEALTGQKSQDRLTVSIFPAADTSQTTLRVTAAGVAEKAQLFGAASKSGTAPSDHGTADAKAVIRACSPAGTGVGPGRGSGHT